MTEERTIHKIVFVQPQIIPPIAVRVAILLNKSPRQVAAFLRRKGNENVTAWPFYTSSDIQNLPNWKRSRHLRVVSPFLHTKQNEIGTIVEQMIENMRLPPVEIMYDESGCFSVPYKIVSKNHGPI